MPMHVRLSPISRLTREEEGHFRPGERMSNSTNRTQTRGKISPLDNPIREHILPARNTPLTSFSRRSMSLDVKAITLYAISSKDRLTGTKGMLIFLVLSSFPMSTLFLACYLSG